MPEFISILRWIRDIVYPKAVELESKISNLPDILTGGYSQNYIDNNMTSTVETIEQLKESILSGTIIVKNSTRGGTFISKTATEINPLTGNVYIEDGGTVFPKLGGGFWARQYDGINNANFFDMEGDKIPTTIISYNENIEQKNKEFVKNGVSKYISSNKNNILEKYSLYGTEAYRVGRLNFGKPLELDPTKTYKICILGDSIALGSDFSSYRTMPGQTRNTGQMLDSSMGLYSDFLVQNLLAKGIKFDLYNRSIGGYSLLQLNSVLSTLPHEFTGREFVTTSKTWYENIKDIAPDILIVSHGMNHTSTNHYLSSLEANLIQPAKGEGWLKDLVIMTTPNPNWLQTDSFGDFKEYGLNGHKMIMQMQQRAWARRNNCYVIDVGNLHSIYRYGVSTIEKSAFLKDDYFRSIKNVGQGDGTSNTINITDGEYVQYESNNIVPEGQVVFNIEVDSVFLSNNTNAISIYPTLNTLIQLKSNKISLTNGTQDGAIGHGSFGDSIDFVLPSSFQLKIDYTEYNLRVYIDNVCVAKMANMYIGSPLTQIVMSGTGNANITPISKYSIWYPKYKNVMAGDDVWSKGTGSSTWGVLPYGGGVNHPNIKGLTSIYLPCISEFVNDILLKKDTSNVVYVDESGNRTLSGVYVNTADYDIEVTIILITTAAVCEAILYTGESGNLFRLGHYRTEGGSSDIFTLKGIVKSGSTYGLTGVTNANIQYWYERK